MLNNYFKLQYNSESVMINCHVSGNGYKLDILRAISFVSIS